MNVNKPPMGWNSWNTFSEHISADLIRETADAMVDTGLKAAGYQYLVIDDCWSKRERDPETDKIVADPVKFPEGMKAVSDYVHAKGLKFGMYSCAGTRTCANYPGSYDHEFLDAETFAEYGVDYLKYDNCFVPASAHSPLLYHRMGTALQHCGRDIVFSACNWGSNDVWSWIRSAGAHLYRSTGDIIDTFKSFTDIATSQYPKLGTSANNCFNDMDMLTVGLYGGSMNAFIRSNDTAKAELSEEARIALFDTEYETEFALWCMASAPLMIGCDVRKMSDATLKLLTNKELIAIDQDEDCRPPFLVFGSGSRTTWAKRLSDGDFAVLMLNFSEKDHDSHIQFSEMGITSDSGYSLDLTDLISGEKYFAHDFFTARVKAHGCRIFRAKMVR